LTHIKPLFFLHILKNELRSGNPLEYVGPVCLFPEPYVIVSHHTALHEGHYLFLRFFNVLLLSW
jgi:hypothetical protein